MNTTKKTDKSLFYKTKSFWENANEIKRKEVFAFADGYIKFLSNVKSFICLYSNR